MYGRNANLLAVSMFAMIGGIGGQASGHEVTHRGSRMPLLPMGPSTRRGPTSNNDYLVGAWKGDGVMPTHESRQARRYRTSHGG